MRQVIQSARSGKLTLKEVPAPKARRGQILVRTRTSLISPGTERMVLKFAKKNLVSKAKERPDLVRKVLDKTKRDGLSSTFNSVMARLDEPIPLGYSACGDVVALGEGCEGKFKVGQRIAIAGAGVANHANYNVVSTNLSAAIPDDVTDEEACFGTLGAISLHAIRNLNLQIGDFAAVIGAGLIGQLAVRLLELSGVRVAVFDYDPGRLMLSRKGNAEFSWNLKESNPAESIMEISNGRGCDGVLVAAATDSNGPLELAGNIARDRAKISLVGMVGTNFPYREFMQKELSVVVSRSYGPGRYDQEYENRGIKYPVGYVPWTQTRNLEEILRRMSPINGRPLSVKSLITHRFPFDQVGDAYNLIMKNTEPHLGVVLNYEQDNETTITGSSIQKPVSIKSKENLCNLGVIGAGAFARSVVLPLLKKMKNCRLHTIAAQSGSSAKHSQDKFGFQFAVTNESEIFENDEINAVLIATPHSNHADLTNAALRANKHVLVEKPLGLNRKQIKQVVEARNRSGSFFQVGFNRRFAPLSLKMREHLKEIPGPKVLLLRINAGQVPNGSWQNDFQEGNGRLLGEVCHFVDLARYLIATPIKIVKAAATKVTHGSCDNLTATLEFSDGSLATIVFTSKGDTAFSKELIEVYAGGTVVVCDNFKSLKIVSDGAEKKIRVERTQNKGHKGELAAFVNSVNSNGQPPVDEAELIEVSIATIAIGEALRSGAPILL